MKTEKIHTPGGQVLAVHVQEGSGTPFLLLHGIPGSSRSWMKVAGHLAECGRTVLVPDLIGFGESTRAGAIADLWLEAQADALMAALDQLGMTQVHLAGHDYGGPVALTLYRKCPERIASLALLATNTFTDTAIPWPLAMIRLPGIGAWWERLLFSRPSLKMMLKQGRGVPRGEMDADAALGDPLQSRAIAILFASALRELKSRYSRVEATLGLVAVPTVVLWGTRDPFFALAQGERTAGAIRAARRRAFPAGRAAA